VAVLREHIFHTEDKFKGDREKEELAATFSGNVSGLEMELKAIREKMMNYVLGVITHR